MRFVKHILLIFLVFLACPVYAQDNGDETDAATDDTSLFDDTGTPDTLNDPENTDNTEADDGEDESDPLDLATHSLEFTAETEVTFANMATGEASISIKYVTHIKQDVLIVEKRWRGRGSADVETEVTGEYAGNEFFTCELEVKVKRTPVDLLTRFNIIPETDDQEEQSQLDLKIAFDKSYGEDWYSHCHSTIDSATLNTIAADSPERYNLEALDLLTPSLGALTIENFDPQTTNTLDLTLDSFETEDFELGNVITTEGSATLTITPL